MAQKFTIRFANLGKVPNCILKDSPIYFLLSPSIEKYECKTSSVSQMIPPSLHMCELIKRGALLLFLFLSLLRRGGNSAFHLVVDGLLFGLEAGDEFPHLALLVPLLPYLLLQLGDSSLVGGLFGSLAA